ncbi:MAG: molybdopterin-dependent oxidoreductase [Burkholderiales bacterium]|nr:molybdopterin-dependent oxidoreductase [Burkholderiales bacterium]
MPTTVKKVPMFCKQCVQGPDLMKVVVEDGVAVRVEPNFDAAAEHPAAGRVCVKAYGVIQKSYNPHRVKSPMKRTNPRKGRDEDPGFVAIGWDEALDMVAARMRAIREKGLVNPQGYPRFAFTHGGGDTPQQYMGTLLHFLPAWGAVDTGFGGGAGIKCNHSEHVYGEMWHRAFIVSADTPQCDMIIGCGRNTYASGGVTGVWREAEARKRGLVRIQAEPSLSPTGAQAGEWLPIKAKTDSAFLYALIHHILWERPWAEICDLPFLSESTTSPYLVAPNGYYLRDAQSRKPLIWDAVDSRAKPFDAPIGRAALSGEFVADGVEEGADGQLWDHQGARVRPAFEMFRDHMRPYTPDWASLECGIEAARIREIADEFVARARVGATTVIDGETMPLRPVAVLLGKNVNNGWGGYQCCWAATMLGVLVGALEVPGSMIGAGVKLTQPFDDRMEVRRERDGVLDFPFMDTSRDGWSNQPGSRNFWKMLSPMVGTDLKSAALGPAHLPWLFQKEAPAGVERPEMPDVWMFYRTNPAISQLDAPGVAERIAELPFTVAFAYTQDESNWMADVLLPEATDLEGLQLIEIGSIKINEQFWRHQGWAIRQPVVKPDADVMDITDIVTGLAQRIGMLAEYNDAINRGMGYKQVPLRGAGFDYSLELDRVYSCEEIWDRFARAASHLLTDGEEVHGIGWFKEHGYLLRPFPQKSWYLYPAFKAKGMRFELPYQERVKRIGAQLGNRLHENGITWWDRQLGEYEALPAYHRFQDIWDEYVREIGKEPSDYPLWAISARSMQYAWSANVALAQIKEVADGVTGNSGVMINSDTAASLGIAEGDAIVIESPVGATEGRATLKQGIRPDTIVVTGQFDQWATPFASEVRRASLNTVTPMSLTLTDGTGSVNDFAGVRVRKASPADMAGFAAGRRKGRSRPGAPRS